MPDRIIRERTLTSETLGSVGDFAERLFWRLVIVADDYGRFAAQTAVIAGRCMPLVAGATIKKVEAALAELVAIDAIRLYERDGKRYGMFPSWERQQGRPRALTSKYPEPDGSEGLREQPLALESDIEDLFYHALLNSAEQFGEPLALARQVRDGENYFDIVLQAPSQTLIFELKRTRLTPKALAQVKRYVAATPRARGILVGAGLAPSFSLQDCQEAAIGVITYDAQLNFRVELAAEGLNQGFLDAVFAVISRDITRRTVSRPPNTNTNSDPDLALVPEGEREGEPGSDPDRCGVTVAGAAIPPRRDGGAATREIDPTAAISSPSAVRVAFDEFWAVYPRKEGKQVARGAWDKLAAGERAEALRDIPLRLAANWSGKDLDHLPHASTYLNQQRWTDELQDPTARASPAPARPRLSPGMQTLAEISERLHERNRRDGPNSATNQGRLALAADRRADGRSVGRGIGDDAAGGRDPGGPGVRQQRPRTAADAGDGARARAPDSGAGGRDAAPEAAGAPGAGPDTGRDREGESGPRAVLVGSRQAVG